MIVKKKNANGAFPVWSQNYVESLPSLEQISMFHACVNGMAYGSMDICLFVFGM